MLNNMNEQVRVDHRSSELSVLLEERLDYLHVHSVVHVGVGLESWGQQMLRPQASSIEELRVLLVVVGEAGDLAALPVQVAHVGGPVQWDEEEEAVHEETPLAYVFELHGVRCLYHFCFSR